jgi:hypothetical protein
VYWLLLLQNLSRLLLSLKIVLIRFSLPWFYAKKTEFSKAETGLQFQRFCTVQIISDRAVEHINYASCILSLFFFLASTSEKLFAEHYEYHCTRLTGHKKRKAKGTYTFRTKS